jgi:hypothetical protein
MAYWPLKAESTGTLARPRATLALGEAVAELQEYEDAAREALLRRARTASFDISNEHVNLMASHF